MSEVRCKKYLIILTICLIVSHLLSIFFCFKIGHAVFSWSCFYQFLMKYFFHIYVHYKSCIYRWVQSFKSLKSPARWNKSLWRWPILLLLQCALSWDYGCPLVLGFMNCDGSAPGSSYSLPSSLSLREIGNPQGELKDLSTCSWFSVLPKN